MASNTTTSLFESFLTLQATSHMVTVKLSAYVDGIAWFIRFSSLRNLCRMLMVHRWCRPRPLPIPMAPPSPIRRISSGMLMTKSLRYFSYPLSARRLSLLSLAAHHLVMCGIHLPLRSTVIPSRESSRSKMNFNLWPKVPSPSLSLVRNSKTYVINWQPWDIRLMTQIKSRWFLHGLGSNFVGFSYTQINKDSLPTFFTLLSLAESHDFFYKSYELWIVIFRICCFCNTTWPIGARPWWTSDTSFLIWPWWRSFI